MSRKLADDRAAERIANPHPAHKEFAAALIKVGVHFQMEKRICGYYVDFCLSQFGLVVEIDGSGHDAEADAKRDQAIGKADYKVIRSSSEISTELMIQRVLIWVGRFGLLCHHCRKLQKSGPRYCKGCSLEKQDVYRVKRLGIPPRSPGLELLQILEQEEHKPSVYFKSRGTSK